MKYHHLSTFQTFPALSGTTCLKYLRLEHKVAVKSTPTSNWFCPGSVYEKKFMPNVQAGCTAP